MVTYTDRRTLAQRLGLERLIVDQARETVPMIKDPWTYGELDWDCPHCGFPVHLLLLDSANDDGSNWSSSAAGVDSEQPITGEHVVYVVCRCPRAECKGFVFAVIDAATRKVKEAFPYTRATADSFDHHIPAFIRDDMAQATRSFYASAPKGTVVLCRRVIQDIAKDKKIDGDTNKLQILAMHTSGLITKSMFDSAHEIRHYGGYGAHPQDDGLDDISPEIAESLLELTNQFLQNIYVMAGRNAELAKRRQSVANPGKSHKDNSAI